EGGPTLTAAFLRAGLVDELILHLAPTLLGAGRPAVADLAISTLADRLDLELVDATPLPSPGGPPDLRLTLHPRPTSGSPPACPRRPPLFSGTIDELGPVESPTLGADPARLRIRSPQVLEGIALGDSIAVSGCCLTVTAHEGGSWTADVISTTLAATSLGDLAAGDRVNLERCVRADGRLD